MKPLVETPISTETVPGAQGIENHERQVLIENTAQTAYNVLRIYSIHLGDHSIQTWFDTSEAHRESFRKGVRGILDGNHSPEDSHKSWWDEKIATGWKYGPVKDEAKKEHPCMVDYDKLPIHHRMKDTIFGCVVRGYTSVQAMHLSAKT
jgi:RyR domain